MRKFAAAVFLLTSMVILLADVGFSQNPQSALQAWWPEVKKKLTGTGGQKYFQDIIQDSALPLLTGTLVSATPPEQPSVLVVAVSDPGVPDVILHMKDAEGKEAHLSGPLMKGSQINFEGIARSFTQEPFMLTFDVPTNPQKHSRRKN